MNYKNIKEEEVGNKVGSNFFKTSDTPETTDKAISAALKGRYNQRMGIALPNLRIDIILPKALKGRYNLRMCTALPNLSIGAALPNKL
jgi:hypothetical protein